jgi:hypothetical protein
MRKNVDAHAHRPDLGCRLVDTRGYAGLVQRERQGQSADAGAYDNRFHAECSNPRAGMVSMVSRLSDYRMDATFPHAVAAVQPSRVRPLILALRPGLL